MQPIIHKKLRKDKVVNGKCPVILQVYFQTKRKQIFTKLTIEPHLWDETKQQATSKHPQCDWFNRLLKNKYEEVEKEYFRQSVTDNEINLDIKAKQSRVKFAEYADTVYDNLSNKASEVYIGKCKVAIRDFKRFAGDLTLQDVTPQVLKQFEDHLFKLGRSRNTINFIFKKIKQPFKHANKNHITDYNPFNTFASVTYKQTKRHFLTMQEVKRLEEVELPEPLDCIRNYFLLSCFVGLRFGDVAAFDKSKYVINNNGVERIIISTSKMDEPVSIKLSPKVKAILAKIEKPLPSNVHTNRLLKIIGQVAKIKRPLNFHLSRHTAAVNMASAGLPMEAVAKILGHTNIRTTAIYYKITDTKIDEYMDRFNDYAESEIK